jgi:hypothetical protein
MYNKKTGDVVCDWCGDLIGNINGDYNFFSLIRTKYCKNCKKVVYPEQVRAASRAYRKRKRTERKLKDEKLTLLEEENRLLRERVRELKNNQEEY